MMKEMSSICCDNTVIYFTVQVDMIMDEKKYSTEKQII